MKIKFRNLIVISIAATISLITTISPYAADFPLTLEHRYGTTVIDKKPLRVVSLSYSGHDNLLALGVKPVALRYWYGDHPFGVWPWAQDALGDHQPEVLKGELNIEKIASLNPDVIVGLASGISEEQYALLSEIAPTVAAEKQYTDYSTPWQVRATTIGKVVGETVKANAMVAAIEKQLADIAKSHPNWQGKTATVSFFYDGAPGTYRSIDPRPQLLKRLGLVTPAVVDAAGDKDAFWVGFSAEDPSPLEADVLIWVVSGDALEGVKNMPLRKAMTSHKQGREVLAEEILSGAFSHTSLLSLPHALDELVPLIELAIDGDPKTIVPTTQAGGLLD